MLAYTGTDFEDKRYNLKRNGEEWDRSEWLKEKFSQGLDFPNVSHTNSYHTDTAVQQQHFIYKQVPYLIDGDVKLSQTFAILKYLGRKHNLVPKNEEEHRRIDLIEAEAMDMRTKWVAHCYSSSVDFVS